MNKIVVIDGIDKSDQKNAEVLIHVRFRPDGNVFTIDLKPNNTNENEWYTYLLERASAHYSTLAGGRGFFRLPRDRYEAILAAAN
jgi:hypothetical protein